MQIGHILMVSALLSLVSSELQCYTDYLDVVTCVWNTSSVGDRFHIIPTNSCFLHSEYNIQPKAEKPKSILKPFGDSQTELRKGTLQFSKNCLMTGPLTLQLFVSCEGMTVETINRFFPPGNVKLYAPEKPVVKGQNVTWQRGSPHSTRVMAVKYEVQWRLLNENWETHPVATTAEEYCELPEDKLIRGKEYVIRVRSIPEKRPRYWSEWSVVTQWTSTVGEEPPPGPHIPEIFTNVTTLAVLATVPIVVLAFFCFPRYRRIRKCLYVPTPGKYFGDLFSNHGGDFK
ncbi:interleukin-2 receptor subunit beta, partial [Clarias magur]